MIPRLKFEPRHLVWLFGALVAIELMMVTIYAVTALSPSPSQIEVLFNLDEEANVPSWFSSMQLFSIGVILLLASCSPLRERDHLRVLVALLGGAFVFLSMDEAAAIHEKVTTVMKPVSWAPRFSGGHGIWMFVYVVIAAGAAAVLFRPILRICRFYPRDTIGAITGAAVLGLGAVGVEAMGYQMVGDNAPRLLKTLQVATEEFLEMLGASIILRSSLQFALREHVPVGMGSHSLVFSASSAQTTQRAVRP
jgi:hypothetical protein